MRKPARNPRGRPREYDPELVLRRARDKFWRGGFAATSLDDLSTAMGMGRPSLYAAFGDKSALYLQALARYADMSQSALSRTLAPARPLREALRDAFAGALAFYLAGDGFARGCFLLGTAITEAADNARVRALLAGNFQTFDHLFEQRFELARERGELPSNADPAALAMLATGVLHTLSLRARAGARRATLERLVAAGVEMICGPHRALSRPSRRR